MARESFKGLGRREGNSAGKNTEKYGKIRRTFLLSYDHRQDFPSVTTSYVYWRGG
jgi:hypothetical protein